MIIKATSFSPTAKRLDRVTLARACAATCISPADICDPKAARSRTLPERDVKMRLDEGQGPEFGMSES
jgi:hypothetical protein